MSLNKRLMSSQPAPFVASENFKVVTYTGNGGTQSINVGFKPDFVWIKQRNANNHHRLLDSTRGATKILYSSLQYAEDTESTGLTAFTSTGFNLGAQQSVNDTNDTYVAWCFKANGGTTSSNTDGTITSTVQANTDAGFSIATWDGNGSSASIGHGLGVAPDMLLVKNLDGTNSWIVRHKDFNGYLSLEQSAAGSSSDVFGTAPDTTKYYFNTAAGGNGYLSGNTYVGYFFAGIDGFSKFGSYTGNGSDNGPIVETGFEPAFLMFKRTDSASAWVMIDNARDPSNPRLKYLMAQGLNSEASDLNGVDFLANGFQIKDDYADWNTSGSPYIYMAFAADPDTEAPTLADSFAVKTYTGNGGTQSITGLGFKPNLVWLKNRTDVVGNRIIDNIWGPNYYLETDTTAAKTGAGTAGLTSFDSDGFSLGLGNAHNGNGDALVAWAWKADDNEPTLFGGNARAVYKFEDNANDVRGNYNGTTSNITYTTGKFNKAAVFVESNSSEINFNNSLHGSTFSMSFWLKATDMGAGTSATAYSLYSAWIDANNYFRPVLYGDGKLLLLTKYAGTFKSNTTAAGLITENTWHHIVFNFTPTDTKAYVDGVNVGTFPTYDSISFTSKALGTDRGTPDFTGQIDQLRFYDAALIQENVTALYEETAADNDDLTFGAPGETIISANANAGFSIVKYEGDGVSGKQVPHGLSAAPEMIISKRLDSTNNWSVYHKDLSLSHSTYPNWLYLNLTSSEQNSVSSANHPYYVRPSATVIYQNTGTSESTNVSGGDYISYCFHSVSGYSKIGSYTGTGTTNSITGLGFQPDWLMIKRATGGSSNGWVICDSVRGVGVNLRADTTGAEADESAYTTSFDSDGFTLAQAGGNTNVSGSTYIYMAFKINQTGIMSWLVIAGGASGGRDDDRSGGGGGAGGLRTSYGSTSGGGAVAESDITLAAGTYTITVGDGGTAVSSLDGYGNDGGDSSIAATGLTTITSTGGGGGGRNQTGRDGGSGGGGAHGSQAGGGGTANQGFDGGQGIGESTYNGGGGGGASAAGSNSSSSAGGAGGAGLAISITGSSATYAGGGGGGGGGTAGSGGSGGGGAGSTTTATAGTANTGSGGGGAQGTSGAGGSGVVILRLLTSEYSGSTTGSPTVTTSGSDTILKFTSSGTYVHS